MPRIECRGSFSISREQLSPLLFQPANTHASRRLAFCPHNAKKGLRHFLQCRTHSRRRLRLLQREDANLSRAHDGSKVYRPGVAALFDQLHQFGGIQMAADRGGKFHFLQARFAPFQHWGREVAAEATAHDSATLPNRYCSRERESHLRVLHMRCCQERSTASRPAPADLAPAHAHALAAAHSSPSGVSRHSPDSAQKPPSCAASRQAAVR